MATERQKRAAEIFVENGGKSVSKAMREAGYSEASAKNPDKLTSTDAWEELMDKYLPEKKLAEVHKSLLNAKYIDHMVFPLATEDDDIRDLLKSVGCTVRKFQRNEQAKHVWFWAPNTKAQKDAVEMGYKVRGRLKDNVNVTMRKLTDVLDELDDDRVDLAEQAEKHLDDARQEAT